ncbi:MICOS complex subunit MIC27 isoform 2-T2 [Discoglossus pictus]
MVSKILKLAVVPAGLAFTSYGLYAVSDREPKGKLLNPNQLSVYSVPQQHSQYLEEQPGRLQSGLTVVRETLWPYVIWGENVCSSIKTGVGDTVQFGKDSYVYLKNPPPEFLPRVGVITVCGLAGLFLARRGSRLKKIAYPLGLTALGVSVCYPAQAVIFAKVTGRKVYATSQWTYGAVSSLWKTSPQKEEKPQTSGTEVPVSESQEIHDDHSDRDTLPDQINTTTIAGPEPAIPPQDKPQQLLGEEIAPEQTNEALTSPDPVKETKFKPDPNLSDHGQSNPEDVDLYSTRS